MSVLNDLVTEMTQYLTTHVVLEIIDVNPEGDALNQGETATFKVKVTNNGPLDLTNVTLKVEGRGGATVRPGLGQVFTPSFISATLDTIGGDGGFQILSLPAFQAPDRAQDSRTLVRASVWTYNANLDHILVDHSDGADTPNGTFASPIVAQ